MSVEDQIKNLLEKKLSTQHVEIIDESRLHAGHAQKGQGGHFTVMIVSKQFNGKTRLERHRMVYEALEDKIKEGIHALALKALSEEEYKKMTHAK